MQAVILAAGLGTRMKGLTSDTPKPLLKVGGKTLLEHKLDRLPNEVNEIIIVVGYLGDRIKELLGSEYAGRKISYVEQKELLGTGHALSLCKKKLSGKFLVLNGDDLYAKEDLTELIKHDLALLTWEVPQDERGRKVAEVRMDSSGALSDIVEGQPAKKGTLFNAGAYVLDERYFNYSLQLATPGKKELGLPQTMLQMLKDGCKIKIVRATWWKPITSPEDLA
ncbi:MAG: nucleotidyltransferase family protein [Candidatus Jorgensenbacteria bacterium]|nr:nucleotidyltransferase family protein [Candidatus Jorgensenbacteria bacterium]